MPKQTFFNLPEEKRETLIQAARKEFSRVPLYEASIANIVKEAEIPRGSFYQYFEDKDDLYFYLLEKQGRERWELFISNLTDSNGDLFNALMELFYDILSITDDEDECNFHKNVFLNMNYRTEETFRHNIDYHNFHKQFSHIKALIDTKPLNIQNGEDLFHIIQITTTIMFQNIMLKFAHNLANEEAVRNYTIQLNLVKRGFLKEDAESCRRKINEK